MVREVISGSWPRIYKYRSVVDRMPPDTLTDGAFRIGDFGQTSHHYLQVREGGAGERLGSATAQ